VPDHSKEELLAFNPKDPAHRRQLWVRVVTPDNVWYHIFWGRIALTLLLVAVAGWLTLAGAVWGFVRFQRGYTEASYSDLLLYPIRKEQYRQGLGHFYLKRAREEMEKRNWQEGYRLLQWGLARVPDDATSRRLLAYTQVQFGRTDLATNTLVEGAELPNADLDYFKLLFPLLLERQDDTRLIALAKKLLPATPDQELTHQYIALQLATAHFERGRYDEAERIVKKWDLERSLEASILIAKCDWERGYQDIAMLRLESEIKRFPKQDDLYLTLIRYLRELGRQDEARRYALLRHFNDPVSPGPRIDMLHTYHTTGDKAAEQREVEGYLKDFSQDPRALLLLASFAADTAQPELITRLISSAREHNFPLNPFLLTQAHAFFSSQKYQAALDVVLEALRTEPEAADPATLSLHAARCLALYGLKDLSRAELMLNAYIGRVDLRATRDALYLARQLRTLGGAPGARNLLERIMVVDPLNQAALTEIVRLDAESGDRGRLSATLPRLLQMRKPSRAVLEETLIRLDQPADGPLRDQIREAIARVSATPVP
jgi:predicted negative regulator of RcsB-dependent stress response